MKAGDKVLHPSLGEGTVVAIYTKGGQAGANVDFGYMVDWVSAVELGEKRSDELDVSPPVSQDPRGGVRETSQASSSLPEDMMDARRGLLALRLGQVLERHVLSLSVGTEEVKEKLQAVVLGAVQQQASAILVEGAWGSGKTHLLTMLNAIAAIQGMATSSVILDGDGVRLSDPKELMKAFLSSLRYPGEPVPCGIGSRLKELRRSKIRWKPRYPGGIRIANAISAVPERALDEPEVLLALEDYFTLSLSATQANQRLSRLGHLRARLPSLDVRSVSERAGRFFEHVQGWTELVTQTGAKGLVLIVDEVDVEYASTIGWAAARREERRRRTTLLLALHEHLRSKLPLVVAFGSAPGSGDVSEHDDPVRDLTRQIGESGLEIIQAPQPNLHQMRGLACRILDLYGRAYPEHMTAIDRNRLTEMLDAHAESYLKNVSSPVPRNFLRRTLELLDVAPVLLNQEKTA